MRYYLTRSPRPSPGDGWRVITSPAALDPLPPAREAILNWEDRRFFRPAYPKLQHVDGLFFCFGTEQVDMFDPEEIARWQQDALRAGDHMRCKTINEAKIEAAVVRRDVQINAVPMELQLETTDLCNAQCIMCNHLYRQGAHRLEQCFEQIETLAPVLPFVRTIYLHGNGESFLLPSLADYVEQLGQYGIRFMTNTNLSVLSQEICQVLNRYFDEINISCDGATQSSYEFIRRGLSFADFTEHCAQVRRQCPRLHMRMCSIAMRQNVMELPQMVRLASELGFNEIVFSELSADRHLKNEADVMLHYPHVMKAQLELAAAAGAACGIPVRIPDYSIDPDPAALERELDAMAAQDALRSQIDFRRLAEDIAGSPENLRKEFLEIGTRSIPTVPDCSVSGICDWCVERPYIDLDGNVSVCCINQHIRLGSLREASLEEIWNSSSAQQIRRTFYEGKLPYFCSGCEFILQRRLHRVCRIDEEKLHQKIRLKDHGSCGI